MTSPVIAVIEDDPAILDMLDVLLRHAGYRVISYTLGRDAHQFVQRTLPDLVILDLWLEHPDAGSMVLGLLEQDRLTRYVPVIICSAHIAMLHNIAGPLKEKGYHIMGKPFKPEELLRYIQDALAQAPSTKQLS